LCKSQAEAFKENDDDYDGWILRDKEENVKEHEKM
jgi:hypothetical protein